MSPEVIHICGVIGQSLKKYERENPMLLDKIKTKTITLSACMSILIAVGALYLYDTYYAQKVVVFDLVSYLEKQKMEFLEGRTNEEKLRDEFAKAKEMIDALGENRIVLSKDMVLSGGKDITDEISGYSEK